MVDSAWSSAQAAGQLSSSTATSQLLVGARGSRQRAGVVEHLADAAGVVLRRTALAAGYDDNSLARLRRSGALVRVRQGAYVLGNVWTEADRVGRHLLLSHAVMRQYDGRVALSHASACVKQGGPDWGLDLRHVHLTDLRGKGERRAAGVIHHRGTCRVGDVTRAEGHWITSPARTALDTASVAGRDAAVCVLDYFLNRGLATVQDYAVGFDAMSRWPDTLGLHSRLRLCDGGSESVGETRTRLLCVDQRLPVPELQWEVVNAKGLLIGRTDFAWPRHGVFGEFDGVTKYLAHRRPNETIEQAVLREKRREDLIREITGWRCIRVTWADLKIPAVTADRIRRMLDAAAA